MSLQAGFWGFGEEKIESNLVENSSFYKYSNIQIFKYSKIQRFKDSKIERLRD